MYGYRGKCPEEVIEKEKILRNIKKFKSIISDNDYRLGSRKPIHSFHQQYEKFKDEFEIVDNHIKDWPKSEHKDCWIAYYDNVSIFPSLMYFLSDIYNDIRKLQDYNQGKDGPSPERSFNHDKELQETLKMLCNSLNELKEEIENITPKKSSEEKSTQKIEQAELSKVETGIQSEEIEKEFAYESENIIGKVQEFLSNEKTRCQIMDKQLKSTKTAIGSLMKDLVIKDDVEIQTDKNETNQFLGKCNCKKLQQKIDKVEKEKEKLAKELSKSKKMIEWNVNERTQAFIQIKNLKKENDLLKNQLSEIENSSHNKFSAIDKWVATSKEYFNIPIEKDDNSEKEFLREQIKNLENELADKNQEIKEMQSAVTKQSYDVSKNKYEIQIKTMSAKVEQLVREIRVIEDGKNYEIREIRQLYQARIGEIVAKQQESQIKLEKQIILYKELENQIEAERKSSLENGKVMASLRAEIESYCLLMEEKEKLIVSASTQINTLEKQISELHEYEAVHMQSIHDEYHSRILEMRQKVACEKLEIEKKYCELQEKLSALQIIYRKSEYQLELTETELTKYKEEFSQLQSQHDVTNNKLTWLTNSIHETLNSCDESTSTSEMGFGNSLDNFESILEFNDQDEEVILVRRLQNKLIAEYESHKERVFIEAHMQNKIDQLKLDSRPSDEKISDDSTDYAIDDGLLSRCHENESVEPENNPLKLQRSLSKFEMFPKSKSVELLKPLKSAMKKASTSHDSGLKKLPSSSHRLLVSSKSSLEVIHEDVKDAEIKTTPGSEKKTAEKLVEDKDALSAQNQNSNDVSTVNAKNPFEKKQNKQPDNAGTHVITNMANPFVTEEKENEKTYHRKERRVSFDADTMPEHVLIRGRRSSDGSHFDFNHFINKMEETQSFEVCKQTPSLPKTKSLIKADRNDVPEDMEELTSDVRQQKIASSSEHLKKMISSFRQSEFAAIIEGSADEDIDDDLIKHHERFKKHRNSSRKEYPTQLKAIPLQSSTEVIISSSSSVYPNSSYSMEQNPFESDNNDDLDDTQENDVQKHRPIDDSDLDELKKNESTEN